MKAMADTDTVTQRRAPPAAIPTATTTTTAKAKMRPRPRARPTSSHGAQTHTQTPGASRPAAFRPARRVFNCIVDDSALVAGVKRSTRNGIRQWVKHGQIRLFVPLHALEELSRQKNGKNKHSEDVRETLQWLDEATTNSPDVVTLQGADETYERWAEVERFAVPRTLFSENNHEHELDLVESNASYEDHTGTTDKSERPVKESASSVASDLTRSLSPSSLRSMHSSASPVSPPTSPQKASLSPVQQMASLSLAGTRPTSSSTSVPQPLQPLFNYILWRVHQEVDPVAALESFIFLCNDPRKVSFAKGFDIKTKRLEQLREAIGREDRDYKNRIALQNKEGQNLEAQSQSPAQGKATDVELEEAGGEALFKPPKAPAAMLQEHQANVIDPNDFSRGDQPQQTKKTVQTDLPPTSPRASHVNHRGSPRGREALPFAPRGSFRGRGNFRGAPRARGGGPFQGRGGFNNGPVASAETATAASQIDPNSFTRPVSRGALNSARGYRKLWVPT
ncbi:hypothetical protein AC579_8913 [Pseudocercospora musae]|uniref:Uncharacterized protein n=1 Tax=Pseudocercospora musae TaxID=113226 RepID=A0A139IDP8_9PEZI|nr:hypothetical protein AC579_8913 [Pseudocercospora musae]